MAHKISGTNSSFGGGTGHWAVTICGSDSFLIFPNFLSRSTTRETTVIYHVYK